MTIVLNGLSKSSDLGKLFVSVHTSFNESSQPIALWKIWKKTTSFSPEELRSSG